MTHIHVRDRGRNRDLTIFLTTESTLITFYFFASGEDDIVFDRDISNNIVWIENDRNIKRIA